MKVKSLSCIQLLATPWTAAYQAPPSMGFSRQEYCSGVPLPSPAPRSTEFKFNSLPMFPFYPGKSQKSNNYIWVISESNSIFHYSL